MATQAQSDAPAPEVAREMALDRAQRRDERQALVAIPAADLDGAALRQTFMPQNMGELMQFANLMATCNFVPAHLRGKQGDCMAVAMQALRWGMDPFAVANKTYFVKDGAPAAFEAQLVNAVVNSSGALSGRLRVSFEGEGEKLRCTVRGFLRADPSDEKVKTVSIARITTRNSPLWKSDPEQQMLYLTTRMWARAWVPEVLMGVYTPEEMDVQPERARVVSPMPRRDAIPDIGTRHDPETGEIDEAEDEASARELDRQSYGRMEGQGGDTQIVDEPPVYAAVIDGFYERIESSKMIGDVIGIEADFSKMREALPDIVVAGVDEAVAKRKAFFKGSGK